MTLQAAVLAWLMTLAPSVYDVETAAEREARMTVIAEAVAVEAPTVAKAATVLAIMHRESRFDRIIHEGGTHPKWTQDRGRSTCMAQIHRDGLRRPAVWARLAGSDLAATRLCARWALELAGRYRHCLRRPGTYHERYSRLFSSYGTGGAGCRIDAKGRAKAVAFSRARNYLAVLTK